MIKNLHLARPLPLLPHTPSEMEIDYDRGALEEKIEAEYSNVKKKQLDLARQLGELSESARSTQRDVYTVN